MAGNKTLTIIKPDAVSNEYVGPILAMISEHGYHIASIKMLKLMRDQSEAFYAIHRERSFFEELINFMTSGPIVVAILEKENAVEDFRKLIGATDPGKAEEGTIRKRFAESTQKNAVHGSDSDENAEIECDFFFSKSERFEIG